MTYESWGRFIPSTPRRVVPLPWRSEIPPLRTIDGPVLAYGRGRSYGDVCLNNGATLLDTTTLSHFRSFDRERGILDCEAGATLDDVLRLVVPHGWFPPVTPGTKFVTVGGCIANDVHGKNHHREGTFGRHVRSLELLRSDGTLLRCAPDENAELFRATIGGLGLTGLIVSAELALKKIESPMMLVERIPFGSLEAMEAISAASDATHDYTVAWFDSTAGRTPRGIFFRGNHTNVPEPRALSPEPRRLPLRPFSALLNRTSVRLFNAAYFRANARPAPRPQYYEPFFYPLDAIANWNAMYGPRGFVQYQFVVPPEAGLAPVEEILGRASRSGLASFLTVIKRFGDLPSPGLLSFPRPGLTVCLDFAARGDELLPMLETFDDIVEAACGRVYPAKDARLGAERFRRFFPEWRELLVHVDPHFSSSFWRRVAA